MRARLHGFLVPAFLLLCLLLGGSVQGVWRTMILQLFAIALIAWAAFSPEREPTTRAARLLLLIAAATLLLLVLQLVPLPPEVWTVLPGRDIVANGYARLGQPLPWLPLSLAPYDTLATSLTLLVPLAVLLGMLRLGAFGERRIAAAILVGTLLGVLLGALQSASGAKSWWHLYEHTNSGAVGFFANSNHMGTLLLVAIPFTIAPFGSSLGGGEAGARRHGRLALGAAGLLLVLVGLALNRSSAAIALALPVIAFSALILPSDSGRQRLILVAASLLTVVAILMFTTSPIQAELAGSDTTSLETRRAIWAVSWQALAGSFPAGTGVGTFEHVFPLYEQPASAAPTYINHAHNDYLELALEGGLAGLLLLAAFLLWGARQVFAVWRSPLSSGFARAATIASGAILAHSAVDFPLKTAGLAAAFAACIAMMAQPARAARGRGASAVRPAKHLVIG